MLELIATEEEVDVLHRLEPFMVFGTLAYAMWQSWRVIERQAVENYFAAFWRAILARPVELAGTYPFQKTGGEWLLRFARAHSSLEPFLQTWETEAADSTSGLMPAAHLAATITSFGYSIQKKNTAPGVWSHEDRFQADQLAAWISSRTAYNVLEAAYFRWPDAPYSSLISEAHQWLGVRLG